VRVAACAVLGWATLAAYAHNDVAVKSPSISTTPHLAVIKPAPDFTLVDAQGQRVRLAELRGRTVLLAFVFTACKSACPLISQQMSTLQGQLTRAGLLPRRVVLLSVTVDPARDTAEALARYAKRFDARPGWFFLRESPEKLLPVLAGYDEWTRTLAGGDLDHPARIYLIDPAGDVREIYSLAFFDERQALIDIRAIDKERAASQRR
jgi:protein SCO1/2